MRQNRGRIFFEGEMVFLYKNGQQGVSFDGERRGKKRSMENGGDDVNDIRETKKPRVGTRRSTRRIANET